MSDYTPTTREVREGYASCAGFDRWLAKYVRQVEADASGPCNHEHATERLAHTTLLDRDSARALLDVLAAYRVDGIAEAWDRGYTSGHSRAMRRMSDEPNVEPGVNPYRTALSEPTEGESHEH